MTFRALILSVCLVGCTAATPVTAEERCAPLGLESVEAIKSWRDAEFTTETPDQAAMDLVTCLSAPDPFLRDKVGYEGLAALLRGEKVSEATRRELIETLTELMQVTDEAGFTAPFAALALSEAVRTDRVTPFLTDEERAALVETAADYLSSVEDYRGFDDEEGWRHGVAHGADVVLQLVLSDAITTEQMMTLREAIGSQINPPTTHAYTFGEPERLARPILYMALRGDISEEDWAEWFAALADPAPMGAWGDVYQSEAGLARLHNLKAFAQSLYATASLNQTDNLKPIETGSADVLKALP